MVSLGHSGLVFVASRATILNLDNQLQFNLSGFHKNPKQSHQQTVCNSRAADLNNYRTLHICCGVTSFTRRQLDNSQKVNKGKTNFTQNHFIYIFYIFTDVHHLSQKQMFLPYGSYTKIFHIRSSLPCRIKKCHIFLIFSNRSTPLKNI